MVGLILQTCISLFGCGGLGHSSRVLRHSCASTPHAYSAQVHKELWLRSPFQADSITGMVCLCSHLNQMNWTLQSTVPGSRPRPSVWRHPWKLLQDKLTFLLKDDRNHIWVVVSNSHVERGLQSHTKSVIRQSLLGLQVWVGPLLEQLSCQICQATATCCVKRALSLKVQEFWYLIVTFKSVAGSDASLSCSHFITTGMKMYVKDYVGWLHFTAQPILQYKWCTDHRTFFKYRHFFWQMKTKMNLSIWLLKH